MSLYADHIDALSKVFAPKPKRMDWMTLGVSQHVSKKLSALVIRNTTFETVVMGANPLLKHYGFHVDWNYSSYDTSFPQLEALISQKKWDFIVLWVDWNFLESQPATAQEQFVESLFSRTTSNYIGYTVLNSWKSESPIQKLIELQIKGNEKFVLIDVSEVSQINQVEAFDSEDSVTTTSCFSKSFDLVAGRKIACSVIPAISGVQLRGIILDLDQTLYSGLLGEDGKNGLVFSMWHRQIWQRLADLKKQGILLAVASKNNLTDVRELLEREDLPLSFEDFAIVAANWDPKAKNIASIIDAFNFSEEFILFIDDNPNELLSVISQYPKLNVFKAEGDGHSTMLALFDYPGLLRLKLDTAAQVRTRDIQANLHRQELANKFKNSKFDYLKELDINIQITRDDSQTVGRVADLAAKTNQFNLTFHRSNENKINELLLAGEGHVYSISLRDRFSDSGIVGGAIISKVSDCAMMEEFLFSCRALGREAETFFLKEILSDLALENIKDIVFKVVKGPKNQPAIEWLSKFEIQEGNSRVPLAALKSKCELILKDYPVVLSLKVK